MATTTTTTTSPSATTATTTCSLSVASAGTVHDDSIPVPAKIYVPNDVEQRDDRSSSAFRNCCCCCCGKEHDTVPWRLPPHNDADYTRRVAQDSYWHARFGIDTADEMQAIVQWWQQQSQQDTFVDTQQGDLPGNALASYYDTKKIVLPPDNTAQQSSCSLHRRCFPVRMLHVSRWIETSLVHCLHHHLHDPTYVTIVCWAWHATIRWRYLEWCVLWLVVLNTILLLAYGTLVVVATPVVQWITRLLPPPMEDPSMMPMCRRPAVFF